MNNIGYVLYQKGNEPGTLNATWCHLEAGRGTEKAWGGPVEGFTGRYHIRYFDESGDVMAERQLDIQETGGYYTIEWIKKGVITAKGIGMAVAEGIAAGWHDVEKE